VATVPSDTKELRKQYGTKEDRHVSFGSRLLCERLLLQCADKAAARFTKKLSTHPAGCSTVPRCGFRHYPGGSHNQPTTSARTLGMGLAPRMGMVASRLGSASGTVSANASAEPQADVTQQRGTCRNLELQTERQQRVRQLQPQWRQESWGA
jgi:hypothetical protein